MSHLQTKLGPVSVGYLLAISAVALFSLKAIFIKLAYQYGVNVETLLTLRTLMGLPFYIGVLWFCWPKNSAINPPAKAYGLAILLGVCSYFLAAILDLYSLQYISVGLERMLVYLYPTLVLLLGAIVFRRSVSLQQVVWVLMSYGGLVLMFSYDFAMAQHDSHLILGSALALLSSLAFAVYVLFSEFAMKPLGSKRFTSVAMLGASVAIFMVFGLTQPVSHLVQPLPVYVYALVIAFVCTVLPIYFMNAAIARVGAVSVSMVGPLGPVVAIAVAYFVLAEDLALQHIIGIVIILFSILALANNRQKAQTSS